MNWKEELLKKLDILAAKLGTTSAYLWNILLKQAYIVAWRDIILSFVLMAFAGCCYYLFKKSLVKAEDANTPSDTTNRNIATFDTTDWHIAAGVAAIAGLVFGGCALGNLYDSIPILFNPQFYALHQILDSLK